MVDNKHLDMTDEWLVRQDISTRSTIIMTNNVYMTNEAWTQAAPYLIKGYWQLKNVKDNTDWYIIDFLHGFKANET